MKNLNERLHKLVDRAMSYEEVQARHTVMYLQTLVEGYNKGYINDYEIDELLSDMETLQ